MLGMGAVTAAPSMAATTTYGSAQLKYTVNATAAISIATNYVAATGAQNAAAGTILAGGTGACSAAVAEASATLTFGGITPPTVPATYQTCYYKQALSVGVNSNDSSGVKVIEYMDAIPAGTVFCAYPIDSTPQTHPTASSATAAAGGGTCATATGGTAGSALAALGAASSGTAGTFGAAGNPGGTDVTATPQYTAYTAGGYTWYSTATAPPAGWNFMGEDVSLSVSNAAASGANLSQILTVALIAN